MTGNTASTGRPFRVFELPRSLIRSSRQIDFPVLLLLMLAIAIRVLPLIPAGLSKEAPGFEAANVAYSFATHGTIADAYFVGEGPTAHLSPVSPVLAGLIEMAMGPKSARANVALLCWAIIQTMVAYFLLFRLAWKISGDRIASLTGLAIICLSPQPIWLEVGEFRYWESALAVSLSAAILLLLARFIESGRRPGETVVAGAATALAFFVNPPAGLALGCCWILAGLRRSITTALIFGCISAVTLSAMVLPWGLRNQQQLGKFIPLRSNFGLELAIAYHADALSPREEGVVLFDRLKAIHPTAGGPAVSIVRRFGEVRYAEARGREAASWIIAHPADAVRLTGRHLREFVFPPFWFFPRDYPYRIRRLLSLTTCIINATGIVALVRSARGGNHIAGYLLLYIAIVAIPYSIVQPVYRYSYLIIGILTFAAAALYVEVYRQWKEAWRRRKRGKPTNDDVDRCLHEGVRR